VSQLHADQNGQSFAVANCKGALSHQFPYNRVQNESPIASYCEHRSIDVKTLTVVQIWIQTIYAAHAGLRRPHVI
jgi:hypothetical protein